MLTSLLLPDSGEAYINGYHILKNVRDIRQSVGYMPGKFSLYQDLTVEENLNFFANIFGTTIDENYDLIRDIYVQIEPFKTRRAGKLSGGMKQKLALSCALIHKPRVLFLDEPTTGVDPVSRKEFWLMLKKLNQEGITILVSTPYMDEAELCDRIALIQHGHILSIDTPSAIAQGYTRPLYAISSLNMFALLNDLRSAEFCYSCYGFGSAHHFTPHSADISENDIRHFLDGFNHHEVMIERITPTIEDRFMELMSITDNHD